MKIPSSAIRRLAAGCVLAAFFGFLTGEASTSLACEAHVQCGPGTQIYETFNELESPEEAVVGCACLGPGGCEILQPGYSVQCGCEDFPAVYCDCDQGCDP